jgi:putative tryptophan/tyrosine transport system substrate-binding protein
VSLRRALAGLFLAWMFSLGAIDAAAADRIYKLGFLGEAARNDFLKQSDAFREALFALGYEEGRNLALEYRWADRNLERLPALARELVAAKVDVIVTHGSAGARAAKGATSSIPIVIAVIGDPVANGVAASLVRPGGNVTGLVLQEFETTVKWLDYLKQILPPSSRVGWLVIPDVESREAAELSNRKEEEAARARGFTVQRFELRSVNDLPQAFEKLAQEVHAVVVPDSSLLNPSAPLIARLATTYRIPTVGSTSLARAGGLIGYGPDGIAMYRRAAGYVDAILKGGKPAEMAMEGPPKVELVLNLKAARALGIRFPEEMLRQADERVE